MVCVLWFEWVVQVTVDPTDTRQQAPRNAAYTYIYIYIFSGVQSVPLAFGPNKQIFSLCIYIPLPLVRFQMSPSGSSYHWGIRLGAQRKKLIAA